MSYKRSASNIDIFNPLASATKKYRLEGTSGEFACNSPDWLYRIQEVYVPEMKQQICGRMPSHSRQEIKLPANDGSYSGVNNVITFDFPNKHPIDFRGGFLMLDVVLETAGGTYKRLCQGAFSMINKCRILFGSMEDEIHYYNRIYNVLWNMGIDPAVQSTIGYDLLGYGLQSDRNTWGASAAGTSYVIPFFHGLLRQGIVPMNGLSQRQNTQLLRIELTLDNPAFFFETDGSTPQLKIVNCRWHYQQIKSCGGRFEEEMLRLVRSGNYHVGFETFQLCQQPLQLGSPCELVMNWKGSAVNWFLAYLNEGQNIANPLVNDRFITWPKTFSNGSSVTQYQIGLGTEWLPIEPIDTNGDAYRAYVAYLNLLGLWKMDVRKIKFGAPISLTSFNLNQFLMVLDLRASPRAWLNESELFNNVSTSGSTSNTLWRIYLSNPGPPAMGNVYFLISYNVYCYADTHGTLFKFF